MSDVFTPSLLTSTKPNAAATDSAKPPSGSLNFSGMTSATALSGTTGTAVALIHGDVWDQIEGNDTTNVLKDQKLTVSGNLTDMVVQNYKETIVGTTSSTYIGVHNQVNISHATTPSFTPALKITTNPSRFTSRLRWSIYKR
jgi:hypothetical protein